MGNEEMINKINENMRKGIIVKICNYEIKRYIKELIENDLVKVEYNFGDGTLYIKNDN